MSGKKNISTDYLPSGSKHFGDVVTDVASSYTAGTGVASVSYAGANPNNNLHRQGTFFVVERCTSAAKVTPAHTPRHMRTLLVSTPRPF